MTHIITFRGLILPPSGGQGDQGHGIVLHVQEEVYQSTLTNNDAIDHSSQKFRFFSLHILVLSSMEPNQGQNTSPWA